MKQEHVVREAANDIVDYEGPSLSSDVRSMQDDEIWQAIKKDVLLLNAHELQLGELEARVQTQEHLYNVLYAEMEHFNKRVQLLEHLFKGLPCDNHCERVLALELLFQGLQQQVELQQQVMLKQAVSSEPLPWGDLD